MTSSGTLELRGFSIHGGEYGILCLRSCSIIGDGTVSGAEEDGMDAGGRELGRLLRGLTGAGRLPLGPALRDVSASTPWA